MTYTQTLTANPDTPCRPGWCLQYVQDCFGLPARYPTATAAWEGATSPHTDRDFPAGYWFPVWFAVAGVPAGHVALYAPDGSVYSTSDNAAVPHHHPSLDDLMSYYANAGLPLTYRGWSEDVENFPVITPDGINPAGTITPTLEDAMTTADVQTITASVDFAFQRLLTELPSLAATAVLTQQVPHKDPVTGADDGRTTSLATLAGYADYQATATRSLLTQAPADIAGQLNAAGIAAQVRDELIKLLTPKP